jgi:hypothetical protein
LALPRAIGLIWFWTPTIKRLGIRCHKPYQCRHTNTTMRLMAGQRLGYAAPQMGHTVDMFGVPLSETVKRPKETVVEPRGKPPAAKPKRK